MTVLRKIFSKLALITFGVIFGLVVLELGVRVFSPAPPLMYVPDETLGWVHPANSTFEYDGNSGRTVVAFNSKGLRSKEHVYEKVNDTYRILVLGDSYVEAADVSMEHTFASKLEAQLRKAGCRSELINSGVGGYGTDQELLFLRYEGWKYSPDLVLLMFTIDNDVHDNMVKNYCRQTEQGIICQAPDRIGNWRRGVVATKTFLQTHWHTYSFLQEKTARIRQVRLILQWLGLSEFKDANEMQQQVPMPLNLFLRDAPTEVTRGWDLTKAIVREVHEEVTGRGVEFAVALIPSNLQLDQDTFRQATQEFNLPFSTLDRTKPNDIMVEFGQKQEIFTIDLLESFLTAQRNGERVVDGHWNALGHQLVAEQMFEVLGSALPRFRQCIMDS